VRYPFFFCFVTGTLVRYGGVRVILYLTPLQSLTFFKVLKKSNPDEWTRSSSILASSFDFFKTLKKVKGVAYFCLMNWRIVDFSSHTYYIVVVFPLGSPNRWTENSTIEQGPTPQSCGPYGTLRFGAQLNSIRVSLDSHILIRFIIIIFE